MHYMNQGLILAVVFRTTPSGWDVVGERIRRMSRRGRTPTLASVSNDRVPAQLRSAACG